MTGSHLQVRLAPVKCRECLVWENETKGGQKYLTVQMNGERYSVWDNKYFDTIREGATVNYDLKQSGNFTHLIDIEPVNGNGNGNGLPPYQPNSKDRQIARMSCLKSASEILAPLQLDPDKKKQLTIEGKKGSGLGCRCPIAR